MPTLHRGEKFYLLAFRPNNREYILQDHQNPGHISDPFNIAVVLGANLKLFLFLYICSLSESPTLSESVLKYFPTCICKILGLISHLFWDAFGLFTIYRQVWVSPLIFFSLFLCMDLCRHYWLPLPTFLTETLWPSLLSVCY